MRMSKPGLRRTAFLAIAVLGVGASLVLTGRPASAEVITGGNFRVAFSGRMTPTRLPRVGSRPISVSVRGAVRELPGPPPPALHEFIVSINRHAHLSLRGLPTCSRRLIKGESTSQALARCRGALVGTGAFTAHINLPEDAPFPAAGRLVVFNARYHGHRALLGHVYGRRPVPTALDMYFRLRTEPEGPFGLTLAATMPEVGDEWGYVTGFEVSFGRRYRYLGHERSVLSAGCPAPAGFPGATFNLARGIFHLADGTSRSRVLTGACHVAPE